MAATLTVRLANGESAEHTLDGSGPWTIGRSSRNDITIPDTQLSRLHASLRWVNDQQYEITDMDSHNGTFIGQKQIWNPTLLKQGSVVNLGRTYLELRTDTKTAGKTKTDRRGEVKPQPTADRHTPEADRPVTNRYELATALVIGICDYDQLKEQFGELDLPIVIASLHDEAEKSLLAAGAVRVRCQDDAMVGVWVHEHESGAVEDLGYAFQSLLEIARECANPTRRWKLDPALRISAALNTGPSAVDKKGRPVSRDPQVQTDAVHTAFQLATAGRRLKTAVTLGPGTLSRLSTAEKPLDGWNRQRLRIVGEDQPVEVCLGRFDRVSPLAATPSPGKP